MTRASRFLTGWVTRFATHDGIPAGRSIKTQRQTTTPKQAGPKPRRAAPVLSKADGTSRRARPAWTRLMPATGLPAQRPDVVPRAELPHLHPLAATPPNPRDTPNGGYSRDDAGQCSWQTVTRFVGRRHTLPSMCGYSLCRPRGFAHSEGADMGDRPPEAVIYAGRLAIAVVRRLAS